MKILNSFSRIPEIYLMLSVILYWFLTVSLFNPIAIGLLIILGAQLLVKNINTGIIISILFLILNLYMCLALISEFNEFSVVNKNAMQLLLFGGSILGVNICLSIKMFFKWTGKTQDSVPAEI